MKHTMQLIALAKEGDREARNQVAKENLGLVWSIVRRFANRGHELDDLYQIGCIGLLKSIDHFDLTYDVKFSTYAVPLIMGEIKRYLRDNNYIKVSRSLKELAGKVSRLQEELQKENGEPPTFDELAGLLSVTKEDIVLAMEATRDVESLYKTVSNTNGDEQLLVDRIRAGEDESAAVIDKLAVDNLLASLETDERRLIELRYYEEKTQTEIGACLGISQVQVSRMEKKILHKMREQIR